MMILINDTILIVILILTIILLLHHLKTCKEKFTHSNTEGIISGETSNQLSRGVKMSIMQRRSDNLAFEKAAGKQSKDHDGQVVSQPFLGN